MNTNLYRDFERQILVKKLHDEVTDWSEKVDGIISSPDGTNKFRVMLNQEIDASEDIELSNIVIGHIPSDAFIDEQEKTNTRNVEGFVLYKKIFAHISSNDAVTNIDSFIVASDYIHKLRNFLKDGNFETAVRYMYVTIRPMNLFTHQELYRTWIKDIAVEYNPALSVPVEDFGGMSTIDYIEVAAAI